MRLNTDRIIFNMWILGSQCIISTNIMKIENILNAVIVKTNNSLKVKGSICDVLPTGKYFFLYIFTGVGSSINNKVQGHLEDRWETMKKTFAGKL